MVVGDFGGQVHEGFPPRPREAIESKRRTDEAIDFKIIVSKSECVPRGDVWMKGTRATGISFQNKYHRERTV